MWRRYITILFLFGAFSLADELKPAKILDAEAYTASNTAGAVHNGNGQISSINHDMNRITVALDGMKITGVYESHWSWSPKASDLVVGSEVKAMVNKGKLVIVTPDGKTIRAKIVRRELQSTNSITNDVAAGDAD